MPEQWISLNQFMKKYNVGYEVAMNMIHNNEVECRKTPGGQYKIKVGGDTVSNEIHEKVVRENEELRTLLKSALSILNQVKI